MTAAFLGGLGLFLLGMSLLTDGLKLAGGRALRHVPGDCTRTRFRGDLSLEAVDRHLTALSFARRLLFQADKARRLTDTLEGITVAASATSPVPDQVNASGP